MMRKSWYPNPAPVCRIAMASLRRIGTHFVDAAVSFARSLGRNDIKMISTTYMNRRAFIHALLAVGASGALRAQEAKPRRIVLRSSWQTVNIGDIAHTPGMLALLEKHCPGTDVTLWPSSVDRGVEEILRGRFPKLKIAISKAERETALSECDFFLHGSGPGLVGAKETELARKSGKPYGFGGITLNDDEIRNHRELLTGAKFIFLRDSDSMR